LLYKDPPELHSTAVPVQVSSPSPFDTAPAAALKSNDVTLAAALKTDSTDESILAFEPNNLMNRLSGIDFASVILVGFLQMFLGPILSPAAVSTGADILTQADLPDAILPLHLDIFEPHS
jgi:hypothetical protein